MTSSTAAVEVYWRPGCSSCLRMKEFMSRSGVAFEEINVIEQPARAEKLTGLGLYTPAVCVGGRCVSGTGLDGVAELIGVPYEVDALLDPPALKQRYELMLDAACRYIAQFTPEGLSHSLPGRDRPVLDIANQTVSVIRGFLAAYYEGKHDRQFTKLPPDVRSTGDLLRRAGETRELFGAWVGRRRRGRRPHRCDRHALVGPSLTSRGLRSRGVAHRAARPPADDGAGGAGHRSGPPAHRR